MTTIVDLSRAALADPGALEGRILELLVQAERPGFFDEAMLLDLRDAVRQGIVSLLRMLADGDQAALEVPRTAGRRQVQQGLPLEGVLRSYRLAGQALWEHFVAEARNQPLVSADALLDGATEVWATIDRFCTTASEAYRIEERDFSTRDARQQGAVLAALLDGRGSDPQFARDAAHAIGVRQDGKLVCVVGLAPPEDGVALDNPRERLTAAGIGSAWTPVASGEVGLVLLGTGGLTKMRNVLTPAVRGRAGISPEFVQLAELPLSHRLAELAARSGPAAAGSLRVLSDDLVGATVVDSPLAAACVYDRTVGALMQAAGPEADVLLGTLRAFLDADGSLNTAAEASFVHRNTMLYRLNKIDKLTGLTCRSLKDQVLWVLGVKELERRTVPGSR